LLLYIQVKLIDKSQVLDFFTKSQVFVLASERDRDREVTQVRAWLLAESFRGFPSASFQKQTF